jgi:magnesium-transporting ATPase (P-type)
MRVVSGTELDAMTEAQLDELLSCGAEVVFARSSPEAKLRIADALRSMGQVVAMTGDGVISRAMLARAWGFLGLISATLVMAGFFLTLRHEGWHLGAPTGPGTPLNHACQQATTVAWLGIVACQIGTAFAVRTDHVSLRSVGVFSNRFLLGGIAFSLAFAALLVYVPVLHAVFGSAALTPVQLATVAAYPFIVWGADETRRMLIRRRSASPRQG